VLLVGRLRKLQAAPTKFGAAELREERAGRDCLESLLLNLPLLVEDALLLLRDISYEARTPLFLDPPARLVAAGVGGAAAGEVGVGGGKFALGCALSR
jgi:hypothetical protein